MFLTPDGRVTDKRGQKQKIPGVALTPTVLRSLMWRLCAVYMNTVDVHLKNSTT